MTTKRGARVVISPDGTGDPHYDDLPDPRVPWTGERIAASLLSPIEPLELEGGTVQARVLRIVTRKVPCEPFRGYWLQGLCLVHVQGEPSPRWVSAERRRAS